MAPKYLFHLFDFVVGVNEKTNSPAKEIRFGIDWKVLSEINYRKASLASSNLPSQIGIRDKEGFDDVENYFSPQKEGELLSDWKVTKTPSKFSNQDKENLGRYEEYSLPIRQDDNDFEPTNDYFQEEIDDESEITFSSKVVASPESNVSPIVATKANRLKDQKYRKIKRPFTIEPASTSSETECIVSINLYR